MTTWIAYLSQGVLSVPRHADFVVLFGEREYKEVHDGGVVGGAEVKTKIG